MTKKRLRQQMSKNSVIDQRVSVVISRLLCMRYQATGYCWSIFDVGDMCRTLYIDCFPTDIAFISRLVASLFLFAVITTVNRARSSYVELYVNVFITRCECSVVCVFHDVRCCVET